MSIFRKIFGGGLLGLALVCLGLYLFNFVFEKHEVQDKARQEEFVKDNVDNQTISSIFDWSQEDNARDRRVRKIALLVIGVGSASIGILAFPNRKSAFLS